MSAVLVPADVLAAGWLALAAASYRRSMRPPLLPAVLLPCGCLRIEGGLLLPCPAHDPAEPPVGQWAAEMEDR